MPRVKIKHPDPNDKAKLQLLRTLSESLVYATRIIPTKDGFVVIARTDEDVDKVFKEKLMKELKHQNFNPILPPELRAKRTIVIFNIDENILKHKEQDIIDEFLAENIWMNAGIDNIFKIPKSNILKITFNDTTAPKKSY